jgi:hypothetical protein
MADNKNPNEKQPGEKPEGKYHHNPGNQSGKAPETVPKEEAEKDDQTIWPSELVPASQLDRSIIIVLFCAQPRRPAQAKASWARLSPE